MGLELIRLCLAWEAWAASADRSEDGWQSDFPLWADLMTAACSVMITPRLQQEYLPQIELCWCISEESEDMADCARQNIEVCWDVLVRLAKSNRAEVRWQVFAVLPDGGRKAEPLLRAAVHDIDAYAKRRAVMALAQLDSRQTRLN